MPDSPPPAPIALMVSEGLRNPLGFYDATPTFSWQLAAPDARQSACQIIATRRDGSVRWDSGKLVTDQSLYLPWEAPPLASREHITWHVRIWDQHDTESPWSEPAWFELGLLAHTDWHGQWIHLAKDAPVDGAIHFRRAFNLDHPVERARLHLTARGIFVASINGRTLGQDFLAPGWTPYDQKLETLTYDVGELLRDGANVLGVCVAPGWYAGGMINGKWGQVPELLAQLEITGPDDQFTCVTSDDAWTHNHDGPVTLASIYAGEDYDARRELPGWDQPDTEPAGFEPVHSTPIEAAPQLAPKRFLPVRVTEVLEPVSVKRTGPDRALFDLGQNLVGVPAIDLPGLAGQTIKINVAEMLTAEGTLYRDNYRKARSQAHYIPAADGHAHYRPTFTFFGFRYVEISGFDPAHAPTTEWLRAHVLHTDFASTGMFSSAHKRLDQLNRNIRWGLRGNFLDIPTDCPQRNERLGWTGDAQVFAPVALFHYDTHAFWASWLESMRLEQRADGTVPHVVPAGTRFADTESSPGWGDAMILIPWEVYLRTGDRRLLEENYAAMTRRLSDYNARSQDGLQTADEGFGDWLQPVMYAGDTQLAGDDRCFGETPRPFLATCYHGCCAHLMTRVAQVLGRQEDAIAHAQTHAQVRQAVTRTCFDDHGRLTLPVETQTGYVLPLAFDLVESSRREAVAGHLAERIKSDGSHLNTGFLGTASLLRALDENGHSTLACHLLFTREYPGWFYSIDQGATTIWERWNSYSHEAGFGDVKMNSFNHYAYGAVGQFLYERLAGLAPDPAAPGYRHLRIRPLFTGHPLTQASAELQTRYGLARNAWEKHDGKITMTTRVPPNATATIILPVTDPGDVKIHEGQAEFHRLDQGISAQVGAGTFKLSFRLPEGPSAS